MPKNTRPTAAADAVRHVEPPLHAMTFGAGRNLAIGRKQRQLAVPPAAFIKGVHQLAPSLALAALMSRYSTCPWTTLPPAQRLFSTIFHQRCSLPSLKRRLNHRNTKPNHGALKSLH
jgi:hypothetical protein